MIKSALPLATLFLGASLLAQLRVDVRLVNIVATVTDSRGRYVTNLIADDFSVQEDGVSQQISHFARSNDSPASVGIVMDTSVSMKPKSTTAVQAVDRFIRDVHPDDEIFFMTFGDVVRLHQDFTGDRSRLSRALQTVALSYGTALFDGVLSGLDKVRKGKHAKKALLLISDGIDSVSQKDYKAARAGVRESKALIYALGIAPDDPNDATLDMDSLNSFAEESGGKVWLIQGGSRAMDLEHALGQVADELRSQYSFGYDPGHDLGDGRWHHVEIRLRNPDHTIRYKQDYFGG